MKKILLSLCMVTALLFGITGCGSETAKFEGTVIKLSDESITVDGEEISTDSTSAVYKANDIVFYLEGQDFTYGEGTEADEHSQEEADKHTVVHISQPGDYAISGTLSAGQIAIDLGEDAKEDPDAVVNLYLDGADVTCTVAPAVIFYNVYECGNKDTHTKDVDTTKAGANVYINDGTTNNISGAYVARIYESYTLNEEGTEVTDSEKLHKYDGAFYSKRTMNINGGSKGDGTLNIDATNEGLDSEMHLTVNGGNINIESGNDGINTNEDEVSVTTINGGSLTINVTGETGEGDGIDSNGWLVINGGTVTASACGKSADAGIDSDMGIHINGGTVIASGNMLDRIETGGQNNFTFYCSAQEGGKTYTIKDADEKTIREITPTNGFTTLVYSDASLESESYSLWLEDTKIADSGMSGRGGFGGRGGFPGGSGASMPNGMERPENGEIPAMPDGKRPEIPNGERPEMPEGMEKPENGEMPAMPDGGNFEWPEGQMPDGEMHEIPGGIERSENGETPEKQTSPEKSAGNTSV